MTSPSSHRIPYCNTSWSVRRTEELVGRLITETRSQLKCNCIESCSKIVYMYESESHTVLTSYGRIKVFKITNWNYSNFLKWFHYKVFYDTALWVTVNEVFVYSPIKLLCDAGNILCLLLGASVLTFVETADYVASKLTTLRCRLTSPSS